MLWSLTASQFGFSQVSAFLKGAETNSATTQMIVQDVQMKAADSTYKFTAIPVTSPNTQAGRSISSVPNTHFPYPVIMVHGIASSSDTWVTLHNQVISQGWSYGGTMNFCLNSDNDDSYSNSTDISDFTSGLTNADFYLVNFNVDPSGTAYGDNGNNSVYSNQAAIYKQGIAMKKAIAHVLSVSGKDKVVVLVHSMGGLATRQYLENSSLWQPDGAHHIAKLSMMGTPHGGSNMSGTFVLSPFIPLDEQSDAVRDLRRDYFYSGDPGVFLYGGLEDYDVMDDMLFSNFFDDDVNCNGVSGNMITGLNQRSIPTTLDYASVIGDWTYDVTGTGDGIVDVVDAQIKTFYPTLSSETFMTNTTHTSLTGLTQEEYLVIDEPDEYRLAYNIQKDTLYNGFITTQASDSPYTNDYDQYRFKLQTAGAVNITADNFYSIPYTIKLTGSGGQIFSQSYSTYPVTTPSFTLPVGTYSLEISAAPSPASWQYPYNYIVNYVNTTPVVSLSVPATKCVGSAITFNGSSTYGATSWTWNFPGGTPSTASVQNPVITYATPGIYSVTVMSTNSTGNSVPVTQTISIGSLPLVTASSTTACSGSPATLIASGASTYVWSTGSTGASLTVNPTANTTYTVKGTSAVGCTNTAVASINVNPSPTVTVSSATVCPGAIATLTATGASTYLWNTGAAGATFTANPMVTTPYTVGGTDANGCSSYITAYVVISNTPAISVNSSIICAGVSTTLTASGVSTYQWNTGSTSASISVNPTITTVYTITGTSPGCSVTGSKTTTVTVKPLPMVSLAPIAMQCMTHPSVTLTGNPAGGTYSGTGVTGSVFDPAISGAGTFTLSYNYLNTGNGCSNTALQTVTVSACTGIDELAFGSVLIYPNPAKDLVYINFNNAPAENTRIELYDAIGKLILSEKVSNSFMTVSISDLSSGMYFIRITEGEKQAVKHLVKE